MSMSGGDARLCAAKIALVYLIVTALCAILGAVYELFSYEVYSYFMLYAFAFPLCGAFLYLIYTLLPESSLPGCFDRLLGHAGIATLTIGSFMTGVLEIYGTTNLLVMTYWILGGVLLLGAALRGWDDLLLRRHRTIRRSR